MNIWCITVGEPLPIDKGNDRALRTGMLIDRLRARGHTVTWWTSAFDHVQKKHRFAENKILELAPGFKLICLYGAAYKGNVSLQRMWNHWQGGANFAALAVKESKPDAIVCSFPTIELVHRAMQFSARTNVPVLLDIRDLWPDLFVDVVPRAARWLARGLLSPWFSMTRSAMRNASGLIGVSEGYLQWGLARAERNRREADAVFAIGYEPASSDGLEDPSIAQRFRELGVDVSRRIALFVGSFGRTYDLSTVITAARILKDRGVGGYQFVLCGSGEREAQWKAEAGGLSDIVFTGWLKSKEIAYLLRHSYVGLAAYEIGAPQGLPNKIFEYIAVGLPIACSLVGEGEGFITEHRCGINYTPRDPQSLANALTRLADRAAHRDLALGSERAFAEKYSAQRVYTKYAEHIEAVAADFAGQST